MSKYICIDEEHNTYQCDECGHIATFEADGPTENGWNLCPSCGGTLEHEEE